MTNFVTMEVLIPSVVEMSIEPIPSVTMEILNEIVIGGEYYRGLYEIVPDCTCDIVLDTANKTMLDNLTIDKIPYEAVSNPQGGSTITIGGY